MTRLDRYGEPIELDDPDQPVEHAVVCVDGWLGEDDEGRPIPCLDCRPHLRPRSR